MAQPPKETIEALLLRNIPRELILGVEEAQIVGAQRAHNAARGMDDGHLPSVVGQLRHFHMNETLLWINGRRSQTRKQMSFANKAIEHLVQPELFSEYVPPSDAVVFFVSCFSGSLQIQPDAPTSIQIAVPDRNMVGWLFREPLSAFIQRYEQQPAAQDDLAKPKLKKNIGKQDRDGTGQ